MFTSPVPLMLIRSDGPALIEVNGAALGECSHTVCACMPLSTDGAYYVTALPLTPLRYAVTRKICFEEGVLSDIPRDISACAWPGGIYEFTLSCGGAPEAETPPTGELKTALEFLFHIRSHENGPAEQLMHAGLRESVNFDALCAFFGDFVSARPPVTDVSGRYVGVIASERDDLMSARLYEFEYRDGLIYNVTEL